jgi:hypothetical protein
MHTEFQPVNPEVRDRFGDFGIHGRVINEPSDSMEDGEFHNLLSDY